jgi:hypothetical protein
MKLLIIRSSRLYSYSRSLQPLWNPNIHYHHHKNPPLDLIPSQINPVKGRSIQSEPSHPISLMHFNIIHPLTSWSSQWFLIFNFPTNILNGYYYYYYYYDVSSSSPFLYTPHLCYLPSLSHPSFWPDHSNYTWWRTEVMKLLITHLSPISCHLIPLLSTIILSTLFSLFLP